MQRKQTLGELRKARGISRAELAVAVGTTYSMIVRIEQGQQEPKLATARRIAMYFGVTVEDVAWPDVAPKRVPVAV